MIVSKPTARAAFLTDVKGIISSWNDGSAALFGLSAHEALGRPIDSLLAPDAREQCLQRWPKLPQQAEALQVAIHTAGHGTHPSILTLVPQRDADNNCCGCVAYFTTLLDRNLSESAIVGQTPLSGIVDALAGTFYVLNRQGDMILWNSRLEQVAEMDAAELGATNALAMFGENERDLVAEKIRDVFENGREVLVEANYISKTGKVTPYLLCGTRISCRGVYYLCGMGLDVSQRHAQEAKLRLRDRALHASSNGIVIARCEGHDNPIEYVNPAFERITGYTAAEVAGQDARFMAAPGLDDDVRQRLGDAVRARQPTRVVLRNRRKDGELFWNELAITPVHDEHGDVSHFIGVLNDVTASKQHTALLEHEVAHDPLTGLANRNLMWDRLEQAIHIAGRNKTMVATVLVDLDGFKQINDTLGHDAGDEVLTAVARRLQASVRDSDTVARLSGDEFVLVLTNQPSLRFTLNMLERLRVSMLEPVVVNHAEIPVGASMGVSVFPNDANNAFDLVRAADAAMYHVKANGRSGMHFYSDDMRASVLAKQQLEAGMRLALNEDEMFLVYQPRLCLRTGRVVGVEALLRWRHPQRGVLLPGAFLADAEENGLIVPIGQRVVRMACTMLSALRARGLGHVPVSINASYREFSQYDYIHRLAQALADAGLPPSSLDLEIREDQLVRNLHLGGELAGQLHARGMRLTVDHFGDGATNLHYLHSQQIGHLKMNQGSILHAPVDRHRSELARTCIDIGHDLGIGVVASAVETVEHMELLRSLGCDELQGRCYSAPLERGALEEFLASARV